MIRCRKMRDHITFQSRTDTSDGMGAGGTVTWTDTLINYPAERWSIKAAERVEAAREKQISVQRWHVRYNSAIVPSMRIKWVRNGVTRYQEILAVTVIDPKDRELEILAEERV